MVEPVSVTLAGRVPDVASSRMSETLTASVTLPAVVATLPVLRSDRVKGVGSPGLTWRVGAARLTVYFAGHAGLPAMKYQLLKNAARLRPEMASASAWNAATRRPTIWPPPYVSWYWRISVSKLPAPIEVRSASEAIEPRS